MYSMMGAGRARAGSQAHDGSCQVGAWSGQRRVWDDPDAWARPPPTRCSLREPRRTNLVVRVTVPSQTSLPAGRTSRPWPRAVKP